MTKEELTLLATKVSEGTATNAELTLYSAVCEALQQEAISWPGMETELLNMEQVSWALLQNSKLKQSALGLPELPIQDLYQAEDASYTRANTIKILSFRTLTAIAAAVATIVFGIWFFSTPHSDDASLRVERDHVTDIAPGKNGATITYSTGEVIQLDSAKSGVKIDPTSLTYNDGSSVHPSSTSLPSSRANARDLSDGRDDGRAIEMTASTAKGQTYVFTLPDGSKVWLNAATTLKFPSTFAKAKNRVVEVSGEAYFEVFENKSQPFVVKTRKSRNIPEQEITVLGTHFNVNSYPDEITARTTLLEGSVALSVADAASLLAGGRKSGNLDHVILKPNEQGTLNHKAIISVSKVDVNKVIAWKNDKFTFEEEDIASVMRKLSRWYNVEVIYEGDFSNARFVGSISKSEDILKILDKITFTQAVHFRIEGRRIYVTK